MDTNVRGNKRTSTDSEYFCNICKTRVPLTYKSTHNESYKHNTFAQIIEESFRRMKSYMDNDECLDITEATTNKATVYFCDLCSKIVDVVDQTKHEKSDGHQANGAELEMLGLLSSFVLGDGTLNTSNVNVRDIYKEILEKSNEEENGINYDFMNEYYTVEDFEDYLNYVDDYKLNLNGLASTGPALKYVDDKYVEITVDYEHFSILTLIPVTNFIGYDISGTGELLCKLCVDHFGKPLKVLIEDRQKHMFTKLHLHRVAQPILDSNCLRQLNQSLSHCGFCNSIIIGPVEDHFKFNAEHARVVENYEKTGLIESMRKILIPIFPKPVEYRQIINKLELKKEEPKKPKKKKSKQPQAASGQLTIKMKVKNKETKTPKKRNATLKQDLCDVCNKYVCINGMTNHEAGRRHIRNLKRLGFNVTVPSKVKVTQVKSKVVRSKVKTLNPDEVFEHDYLKKISFCKVCQKQVPNTYSNLSIHTNGRKHRNLCKGTQ